MRLIPKILVVDDKSQNIKQLVIFLSPADYDLAVISGTDNIIKKLSEDEIDLVIIDSTSIGIDGFGLVRKIRADVNTKLTPIILIIDGDNEDDRKRGAQAGCDDFISRPFDKAEVLTRVNTIVRLSYNKALLDEREKLDYVMNNIGNGIAIFDDDARVTYINDKAKDLLGINIHSQDINLLGHILKNFEIKYEGDLNADIKLHALSFDIKRPETDDAKPLVIAIRSSVVKNPLRHIHSVLFMLTDVTDVRMQEFLKQNFLSLISHKLRTPTTVIAQSASMLAEGILGGLTDKQQKAVSGILDKSFALSGLVEKLLGFTTINDQRLDLPRECIGLKEYLPLLATPLVKLVADKKTQLSIDCPLEAKVNINKVYFDLIIGNIIENAIKFNDKDIVKLDVMVKDKNDSIEISVIDNGPGISSEEKEKIFEKFYQVDRYFTGNVEGAGLGLAIVKYLVTSYGGRVCVESEMGKGSKFIFTLPVDL